MKTRKYQLMLRAYLRGLLPRRHIHGTRSRIRERLLLTALDAEEIAAAIQQSTLLAATVISGAALEPGTRKRLLRQMTAEFEVAELARNLDSDGIKRVQRDISGSTATDLYNILEREGLVGDKATDPNVIREEPED